MKTKQEIKTEVISYDIVGVKIGVVRNAWGMGFSSELHVGEVTNRRGAEDAERNGHTDYACPDSQNVYYFM